MQIKFQSINKKDLDLFYSIFGRDDMMQNHGGTLSPKECESKFTDILNASHKGLAQHYKIVSDTNEKIGYVGFWPRIIEGDDVVEIGYMVLPEFKGQGIATRASEFICKKAEAKFPEREIVAITNKRNTASRKVLEKSGFTEIKELKFPFMDRMLDSLLYKRS